MPVDPVCSMEVVDSELSITRNGQTYSFCSEDCRDAFEQNPEQYLDDPHPHLEEHGTVTVPRLPIGRATGAFDVAVEDPETLTVGDRVTFTKTITDIDMQRFAEATSDTNALHLNDAFAEKTRFGGRIVHGTLVSGLISSALACFPGVTIYLSQNLEFERPVGVDETITAICEIVDALEDDEYRVTTRVENEAGKLVIHGTATILVDELPT